jgi:tRNA C32,U32 (ribose-2'-O)-methylase TrmJ
MEEMNMKLATALSERADIQRRLSQLHTRLNNNAKVQEGDEPAEDPKALLKELDALLERLEWLMARINLTNSRTLADGVTVTELIARRDCLSKRLNILRGFLDTASEKVDRYSQKEIKILSTVKVSQLQKQVDAVSKELRELDERIQGLNWTTELLES